MRVFLDTNVLVAAFATRGLCADVFRNVLAEHDLVTGKIALAELERVLQHKLGLSKDTTTEIKALLLRYHVEPLPQEKPDLPLLDPDDLLVLGSALAAHVDVLVTGDQDLLAINDQVPIHITDPRGFWNMVKGRNK